MQTTESIQRKIGNTQDLHSLVRTLKTLAAVEIRHYEKTVKSIGDYYRTVEMGLQVLIQNPSQDRVPRKPPPGPRWGAVVFGSDQGLCGAFNERVVQQAGDTLDRLEVKKEDRRVLAVGTRAQSKLEESGLPVSHRLTLPGSRGGFVPLIQDLLLTLDTWREEEKIDQIYLFYNTPGPGAAFRSRAMRILPLDPGKFRDLARNPWPTRALPLVTLDWNPLYASLVRQYLSVVFFRALAESLMSENASRLAAMQRAERNIEDHLDELNLQYQMERQNLITGELLDVIGGFEALKGSERGG